MKLFIIALAATAFAVSPNTTKFDANKTSMLSGFQIVCPEGDKSHTAIIDNGIEICDGVKLIAPDGHSFITQYDLFH